MQGSLLGPTLYLLFTSDLPTPNGVIIGTFADDTAVLSTAFHPQLASSKLQLCLNDLYKWLKKKWQIKVNESKSVHVTFTLRKQDCSSVTLNNVKIPASNTAKYLGLYLDRKLNWKHNIFTKRKALGL